MANYPSYQEFLGQMDKVGQKGLSGQQVTAGDISNQAATQSISTQDLQNLIAQQNQNIAMSQSQIEAQTSLDEVLKTEKDFQAQLNKFLTLRPLYEPVLGKDYMDKKLTEIQSNAGISPSTGQPAAAAAAPATPPAAPKTGLVTQWLKGRAANVPAYAREPIIKKSAENPKATVAKALINKIFGKNFWGKG